MKGRAFFCVFIAFLALPISALAQPQYYAKAKQIAHLFPAELEGFRSDSTLFMRNVTDQTTLLSLEQMYYNQQGEIVRIIMRDFSENEGLFEDERNAAASSAPDDIKVMVTQPFKYHWTEELESLTIFLDAFTTLEIIHENMRDIAYVPKILQMLNIAQLNEFQGIN